MNLNEMEIPCDPILDKAKRDELVQNTELLKQVTIKPIPWLPGRDYITTEQVARFFDGDVDEVKELFTTKKYIGKGDREMILRRLANVTQCIESSSKFIFDQFQNQIDKTITEAKGEIEAFAQNKINAIAQQLL